jgi:hypothetical protein
MKFIFFTILCFIFYKLINRYINLFIIGLFILIYFYKPSLLYDSVQFFYNLNKSNGKPVSKQKRNVSESLKKIVASEQQWKCSSCNILLTASYEIDHIVPLYKGGSNNRENLSAMCRNCHGNKTLNDKIR